MIEPTHQNNDDSQEQSEESLLSDEIYVSRIHILAPEKILGLMESSKRNCVLIACWVFIQSAAVCFGAYTVLNCHWTVWEGQSDYRILATLMYLYDADVCGSTSIGAKGIPDISNKTSEKENEELGGRPFKYNSSIVKPIKREEVIKVVRNRVAARSRKYLLGSIVNHMLWSLLSLTLLIFAKCSIFPQYLSPVMATWVYGCITIIILDIFIAMLYLADIQQCISKSMIMRYSGWANIKLADYDGFVGWIPLVAGACWLRGILPFALNVYCASKVHAMKKKLKRRRVKKRLQASGDNDPIPDVGYYPTNDPKVLHVKANPDNKS